jgi:hypothetical protein
VFAAKLIKLQLSSNDKIPFEGEFGVELQVGFDKEKLVRKVSCQH